MFKDIFKDKKILLVIGLAAVILITAVILAIVSRQKMIANTNNQDNNATPTGTAMLNPEFLTASEKASLGVSGDINAQVVSRDASGTPAVYKIIKNDSDIVDPAKVPPINPSSGNPGK